MALALEQRDNAAKRLVIVAGWAAVVLLFSSQWYAYDVGHGFSDPFIFYLGWSCYLWGILTPLAVWLAWRYPIQSGTWKHAAPLHLVVNILFTMIQLPAKASIAWSRHSEERFLP